MKISQKRTCNKCKALSGFPFVPNCALGYPVKYTTDHGMWKNAKPKLPCPKPNTRQQLANAARNFRYEKPPKNKIAGVDVVSIDGEACVFMCRNDVKLYRNVSDASVERLAKTLFNKAFEQTVVFSPYISGVVGYCARISPIIKSERILK